MIELKHLTTYEVNDWTNGCGPKTKAGILHRLVPELCYHRACVQHDVDYLAGGTTEDRLKADRRMLRNMMAIASGLPWWRRPLASLAAWGYYRAVRRFGKGAFTYRDRALTLEELRDEQQLRSGEV